MESESELREALAEYAHKAWSGWMRYMFKKSHERINGTIAIPPGLVARWKRQTMSEYADLPESEKESDRKEADQMVAIMLEHGRKKACSTRGDTT